MSASAAAAPSGEGVYDPTIIEEPDYSDVDPTCEGGAFRIVYSKEVRLLLAACYALSERARGASAT